MIIVEWDPPKEVTTQFLFIRSYDVYYKRLGGTVNAEGSWGHKTTNALLTGMEFLQFAYNLLAKYLPFIIYVASGSKITHAIKSIKPLVVYRFLGNVMTSMKTLRT